MSSSPRAIAIVRVSQRTDDTGQSPEVQTRALGQMADLHEWSLDPADLLDENIDGKGRIRKKSAGAQLEHRPKLAYAVEEIEAGRARILAAENFDRLFRNLEVQRQVVGRVESAGGEVWERSGRISHKRAQDKFVATIKGGAAEYVRDSAEERSWDAVRIAIEQGKVPWWQTAPGYTRDEDSRLHVDDELAPIMVSAFEMRRDGATIVEVRAYLAEYGIHRSYHGVMHLLRDRIYVGEIHFGDPSRPPKDWDEKHPGERYVAHTPNLKAHKPIIDRGLFDAVQNLRLPRGPRASSDRMLARLGVLRCESCGARLSVGTANHGRYPIYRCPATGDCARRVTISAEIAETVVVDEVRRLIADVQERVTSTAAVEDSEMVMVDAQARLDAATRIAFASGMTDEPGAVEELTRLREERDGARAAHEQAIADLDAESIVLGAGDWDLLQLDEQRALIVAVVERATVSPEGRGAGRITVVARDL